MKKAIENILFWAYALLCAVIVLGGGAAMVIKCLTGLIGIDL